MSKYGTAKKESKTGKYHRTFNNLWERLDAELVKKLTGKQLGKIIDEMYNQNVIGRGGI